MSLQAFVKNKVKRARVVGGFLRNSLIFKLKRQTHAPRYWFTKISTVVVDMDGTLFDADAGNMGLRLMYPDKVDHTTMGDILYEGILHKLAQGQMSVEESILDGNRLLQYQNMHKKDFKRVLEVMWPTRRIELIDALRELKQNQNVKIILATLSSQEFAFMVNEKLSKEHRFTFDGVIGSKLSFDKKGKLLGMKEIMGLKNGYTRNVRVRSKLGALKEFMKNKNWSFSMNQTVLITDSYGDIDMAKHVKTILLVPAQPSTIQAVAAKYKLADKLIPTNTQLKKNLLAVFERVN
ncbi:MAG: haloacid dehalogenase-like hydrolase [Candidatus Diapherotrites archaeon]|uniref:Haloacid dehalogenase-like hydrolase n=1 Tax=Candidatus Iainarchaeum sp. TaxID=3101447 RepID=A0A8T4C8B6_9ARCH|nr:haloacid dehalogenase-like hydrolase [Candidatus Diapherotrites archaeon]